MKKRKLTKAERNRILKGIESSNVGVDQVKSSSTETALAQMSLPLFLKKDLLRVAIVLVTIFLLLLIVAFTNPLKPYLDLVSGFLVNQLDL